MSPSIEPAGRDRIDALASTYARAFLDDPMTSWLAGRFGRRRYFVGSILIFTAASFLCGLATTLPQLVIFRVIQGLRGGALM